MRVFNLAEELEKERKKNKELEKQVEELKKINKNFAENLVSKESLSYRDYKKRIDKAIEYIETLEKREAYKIVDNENGVPSLVVDNEEYLVLCKYNKLLDILKRR